MKNFNQRLVFKILSIIVFGILFFAISGCEERIERPLFELKADEPQTSIQL